ncbi:helix-turn-helix transcriptional regulator [Altererythrobacter sp. TH136]|uniref:helix-turn-helix domain-containing protein n=1 Tax=Altererythrobacter sp. TH136 TaxID=2067415 RepID=UPI00143DBCD2|nr:helix-turn-helix transcriptional regulator [Altererythrobacter sp. TH136]
MGKMQESDKKVSRAMFPAEAVPQDVGSKIAGARLGQGWTQDRLATKSGVARVSVLRVEGGERRVRPETIFRIAHALSIDMHDLVPDWPEWELFQLGVHGQRTRERRRALGLSAAQLARAAGVSEATLSRHERGIGFSPSLLDQVGDRHYANNEKLAVALGFADIEEFEQYCGGKSRA